MNRSLAAVALFITAAPTAAIAQNGAPSFVPKDAAMVRMVAEDVPALLKKLPDTALGRLLAEPEVDEAFATFLSRMRAQFERAAAVRAAAKALGIDMAEDADSTSRFMRLLDLRDCQRFEAVALTPPEGSPMPRTVVLVGCTPKAEGKATRAFEAFAQQMASAKVTEVPDAKIGGMPAHVFEHSEDADSGIPEEYRPLNPWLLHLPGVFVLGEGPPDECGTVAPAPARSPAHVSLRIDVRAYLAMIGAFGAAMPAPMEHLGDVEQIEWRGTFAGERILDEIAVTFAGKGLLPTLLSDTVKLPAQPMPDGALLQLRCALDVDALLGVLGKGSDSGFSLPDDVQKDLVASWTGGLAIGVAAPARGSMLPRIHLAFGVKDAAVFRRVLVAAMPGDSKQKQVTYEGVECTAFEIPGLPSGLQPAFCELDGVLHLAESGASLRAFLKARGSGGDAMDVGDAPVPPGTGDVLPGFDLRCDAAAMYRAFHEVWLPAFELLPNERGGGPMLKRADMPSPDVVGKHVGKSRGVLRRDGRTLTLQHLGALGGPEAAALAMTWGPIVAGYLQQDWTTESLSSEIAKKKLALAWQAIDQLPKDKPRPATLGELFVAAQLPDDALLVPGDALAEDVAMPPGSGQRKIKSSFRFFPATVEVSADGAQHKALFVAIATRWNGRVALGDDGTVLDLWDEDGNRPIGQFK